MVVSAAFDPEGKYFALAEISERETGHDGLRIRHDRLRIFDVATLAEIELPHSQDGRMFAVAISPNGRYLAVSGFPRVGARVWDMDTRKVVGNIAADTKAFDFSPTGDKLVVVAPRQVSEYSVPELKKVADFEITFPLSRASTETRSLDVSPNGKMVAVPLQGVRIWDMTSKKQIQEPYDAEDQVGFVKFSPDSKLLVCMNQKGLRCWDVERQKQVWAREGLYQTFDWTPDGTRLIASSHHDGVHYIDPKNGWTKELVYPRPYWASAFAFSPDTEWLIAGGQMEIRVRNLKTGKDQIIKQEPYIEK
jgi:WD40 repeat protein